MPTISANASQQITIPAGQRLRFLIGGAGIGVLAAANGFDGQFQLGPSEQIIGPFPSDRVFRVSCVQAVSYVLQAPPFDQYLSNGNSVVSQDANGNQYANGSLVSGAGNVVGLVAGSASAATANTTAINAALALKGRVAIEIPGTYYINGSLTVYEDTLFRIGPGVTIYRADNAGTNMVECAYQAAPRVSVTTIQAAAVAGSAHAYLVTVTFASAHNMAAGQYVQVWGDTRGIYNGVWKIISAPSQTTLTFRMGRGNIGTPPLDYTTALPAGAGTITGNLAVGNLTIDCDGIFDGNGNNGNASVGFGNYGFYLNKIGHSRIKARIVNCYWHNITPMNAWNLVFEKCYLDCFGVAIQAYGPCTGVTIRDSYVEATGDDGFAFLTYNNGIQAQEPPFVAHHVNGDIVGVTVLDCKFNKMDGSGCVTLFNPPTQSYNCDAIRVQNLELLGSGTSLLAFNGNWGSFEARGLRFRAQQMNGTQKTGGTEKIFFLAGSQGYAMTGGKLVIADVSQIEVYGPAQGWAGQTTRLIDWTNQAAGTVIDQVQIENCSLYFDTTAYNSSTGYYLILADAGMKVNQMVLRDIKAKSNGGTSVAAGVFGPGGMTVGSLVCDSWVLAGAALSGIAASFANSPKITASSIYNNGAAGFISCANTSFDLTCRDIYQTSTTAGFFNFYGNGSSGTIKLNVSGANITGTAFANFPTSNAALKYCNVDGTLPIDGTKATYLSGALFYNSNAAYTGGTGSGIGLYAMGASATTKLAA